MNWKKGDKFIIENWEKTYWSKDGSIHEVLSIRNAPEGYGLNDQPCVYFKPENSPTGGFFALIDCIRKPTKLELSLA